MPSVEFASASEHALALMRKVADFYAKYHILELDERSASQAELKQRQREWAKFTVIEQQHIDYVIVLMRELLLHYQEWMQDDRVAQKRWRLHPGDELSRLRMEATSTIAQLESAITHQSRKLSVLEAKEAWA